MLRHSVFSALFCLFLFPVMAENSENKQTQYEIGDVSISNPWTKNTAKDQKNGAVYMKLISQAGDHFIKAEAPEIAERIELHMHKIDDQGVAKMVATDAIELKAKEEVKLMPRGLHVMLFGLKKEFKIGDKLPMKLTFQKAGTQEVIIDVKDQNYSCCGCTH